MKIVRIKPMATLVAQLPAGVEQEVVVSDNGTIYIPMLSLGEGFSLAGKAAEAAAPAVKSKAKPAAEDAEETADEATAGYTEEDLMNKETEDLLYILKNEFKKDPSKYPGKNSHKKLRDLIMKFQGEADDETEKPSKSEKPAAKGGKAATKAKPAPEPEEDEVKGEVVEVDDLEVGDRVNVYWNNLEEWYEGNVIKKSKAGKLVIKYDDETEEIIDPEIHTEVRKIDEE